MAAIYKIATVNMEVSHKRNTMFNCINMMLVLPQLASHLLPHKNAKDIVLTAYQLQLTNIHTKLLNYQLLSSFLKEKNQENSIYKIIMIISPLIMN